MGVPIFPDDTMQCIVNLHCNIHVYIYIKRERERERYSHYMLCICADKLYMLYTTYNLIHTVYTLLYYTLYAVYGMRCIILFTHTYRGMRHVIMYTDMHHITDTMCKCTMHYSLYTILCMRYLCGRH